MRATRKSLDWLSYLPEAGRQISSFLREADEIDRKIEDLDRQLREARAYATSMAEKAERIAEISWTENEILFAKQAAGVK